MPSLLYNTFDETSGGISGDGDDPVGSTWALEFGECAAKAVARRLSEYQIAATANDFTQNSCGGLSLNFLY